MRQFENCQWFNLLISKWWPTVVPSLSHSLGKFLEKTLNDPNIKPSYINKFEFPKVNLGTSAPYFDNIIGIQLDKHETYFKCNCDVMYMPMTEVEMVTRIKNLSAISIKCQGFKIQGRLAVTLEYINGYPYIDYVEFHFLQRPKLKNHFP